MEEQEMRCNNCGRNEVNFHYSSSINGCVTETNLCSECAQQAGYDLASMFDYTFLMLPFTMRPVRGMIADRAVSAPNICGCGCKNSTVEETKVEVDEVMKQRRELNIQMKAAVDTEDFETAAKLRDRIKELGV